MTIEKGREWGETVGAEQVAGCPVAASDRLVADSPAGTLLQGGDLGLTLGVGPARLHTDAWQRLPVDLLDITWVDRRGRSKRATAAAWVTVGTFHSGPFVVVANSSFVRGHRVFPRSHPNDGRFEILDVQPRMSLRQRFAAVRRIRTDSHLPHPLLGTRSGSSFHESWTSPRRLVIDGRKVGSVREITVEIRPDAGITYVAT